MIYTLVFFGLLMVGIKMVQGLAAFEGDWGTVQWVTLALLPVMAATEVFVGIRLYKLNKKAKEDNAVRYQEMLEEEKKRKREFYMEDFESPAEALEADGAEAEASGVDTVTGELKAGGDAETLVESAEGEEKAAEPVLEAEKAAEASAEAAAPYSKFDE